jgi:hypothetical protein
MTSSVIPDVVRVPLTIRKRGGRKLVLVPGGNDAVPDRPCVDNAMIKALARAFRWRKLLETGVYGTIEELAAAEKFNSSYISVFGLLDRADALRCLSTFS